MSTADPTLLERRLQWYRRLYSQAVTNGDWTDADLNKLDSAIGEIIDAINGEASKSGITPP